MSKKPIKETAKTRKRSARNTLTHTLLAIWLAPPAPRMAVTPMPRPTKVKTIPTP